MTISVSLKKKAPPILFGKNHAPADSFISKNEGMNEVVLLTLLGAAGEALGYDRHLKSNTSKKRTHSLFRQGAMLYELIPMMPEPRLRPLLQRFGAMLLEIPVFAGVYGVI
jgi:hypothetical protein